MATYGIDRRIIELLGTYHKYILLPKQIGPEVARGEPIIVIKWEGGFPDTLLSIWGSDKSVSHITLSMDAQTGDVNIQYVSDNFKPDAEFIKELIRKYATIRIPRPREPPAPPTPRPGLASAKAAASNLFSKAKSIFSRGGKRHSTRRHRRR
jgi:hypothetical protein